ncbi:outer membrane usher protein [Pseudomonas sp. 09C 129]|uniref:fimbrial biogenesis usher protein n=1 Tax=Pseudomonas sp. 09C 129 TaxID=2054915 RepID=UPI000C6E5392|nr:fimbrial biogenesis usher protein [Pseudomonas sp. 09C 129]AUG03311.1 outer membrane usher protein [Pseudomonas sp. 09C 129]
MTLQPTMAHSRRGSARKFPAPMPAFRVKPLLLMIAGLIACGAQVAKAAAPASPGGTAPTDAAASASFDQGMLKSLGLDPKVAEFFSQAPRFTEGRRRVGLQVNGSPRGSVDARFDAEGALCFDRALMDQANLRVPADEYRLSQGQPPADSNCYDFAAAYPQTEVELRPNREEVALLVSSDALRPIGEDLGIYQGGGSAGLFNYEVLGQNNQFSGGQNSYYAANTELGFNAGDWIVRSRQAYSMQNEVSNFQSLYTYAQKTFVPLKSTLQAGQINISNSVFQGAAITGVQVVPEAALQGRGLGGATVEGIAQSSARVEVRQAGALIHTSLVPAGPFSLPNVQLLNGRTDLDVRVIEADGSQRSFTIPAASLSQVALTAPGYSVAAGKVRTFDARDMQSPMVVTGTGGWLLNPSNKVSTGLMLSDNDYRAAAWTLDSSLTPSTVMSVQNTFSNAGEEGKSGTQASISLNTSLTERISAGVNATRQTEGYRDLLDTTREQTPGYTDGLSQQQYGVSLGWNDDVLGALATSYSTGTTFDGRTTRHLNASWVKTFKHATVSLNVERSLGGNRDQDEFFRGGRSSSDNGNAMYLTVSVPLGGKRNVRAYANKRDGSTRFGTTYDDNSNDFATYRLSAERDTERKEQDFSGNLNLMPRYAQVNLGYARNGADSTSYSGQLRGGVAVHENGVTLSPYALSDTFGVAKVGDVGGVKLTTPSGPVWTDPWGNAVIPQLNAYQNTRVEIETKSLPRNVDIQNGFKSVSAGRGSVQKLDFPVVKSRRALLRVTDAAGQPMSKGLAVFDAKGNFVTTVVDDGKVFLTNGQLSEALNIHTTESTSCVIHFSLPQEPDLDVYFETAKATCAAS